MFLSSFQITLIALEIIAVAGGSLLLARYLKIPGFKPMATAAGRLAYWPLEGFEVALLVVLILLLSAIGQGVSLYFFDSVIKTAADQKGLEVAVHLSASQVGGLLAWPLFYLIRRRLFASYNATPPVAANPTQSRASWPRVFLGGFVTLLVAMPVIILVSQCWIGLLNLLGLPSEAQDMIAIFKDTRSPLVVAGMLVAACVLAPIYEELLFRRGIYHYFRQRFGRILALIVSASLFGLMHRSLTGFMPLTVLGVILALAYERTGDIRVPIIAHGLFNLNTIVALLAGLSG